MQTGFRQELPIHVCCSHQQGKDSIGGSTMSRTFVRRMARSSVSLMPRAVRLHPKRSLGCYNGSIFPVLCQLYKGCSAPTSFLVQQPPARTVELGVGGPEPPGQVSCFEVGGPYGRPTHQPKPPEYQKHRRARQSQTATGDPTGTNGAAGQERPAGREHTAKGYG